MLTVKYLHNTTPRNSTKPKTNFLISGLSFAKLTFLKANLPTFFGPLASVKQLATNSSSWCSFHVVLLVCIVTY